MKNTATDPAAAATAPSAPAPQPPLLLERQGAVATLRFNRPEALNAIDVPMANAFLAAVQSIAADPGVRAVVLRGNGRGFMAGGDLATLRADPVQGAIDILTPLNAALQLLAQMNAPVIAQVHGAAAGAGLSLVLMADYVIAAEGTRFNLAYINLGTSCDVGASWALPRIVGVRQALEIALLGEAFTADNALRLGLVNRVVPGAELDSATTALAQRLASGPTLAYGAMKRLMRASMEHTLPEQLAAEKGAFVHCAGTEDFRAGVEAFHQRQSPQFVGR
ncbi:MULTISPECIES: enoyl-CoA hydratase/isomerase family protein [unclassified Acidovorax]|uniref:enoyl-CoA hydratase/isomerase family protein n=1 Tax=unclassified Acidovorax TaxID=2684926 RepID=UPI000C6397EC|nr:MULTISPECIES: enoyl-CoA hydratase-related protein [unclassified Acidovorax]PIF20183.1 enoyl-CoA hydratase [Acidovorax sp. 59]PKW00793.1 enoyl-CoA hydratase [Acidovorax sp. 30]